MSAWSQLRNKVAVGVATYYGGPAGGAAVQRYQDARAMKASNTFQSASFTPKQDVLRLDNVPLIARQAGPLGMAMSAATIARIAMSYANKFPGWASAIGLTGIMELVRAGTLPAPKRRRRKGISASDLSKFKRVAGFLYKWGPMCQTKPAPRRRARC